MTAYKTTSWKQTEVGKIPADWDVKTLGDIFNFSAGGDVDKNTFSAEKTDAHIYPIYANALVDLGLYGYSSKYTIESEAVTITGRGDIGKVFYRSGKFTPIVRLLTGITGNKYNTKFLSYACCFIKFNVESTGVPQLTVPQVEGYAVSFPTDKSEQSEIAKVLSDIDALVESLEKLRDKKRAIKTGAMQELLTGHRRLPGFTEPWEDVILGDENIAQVLKGVGLSKDKLSSTGKHECILYGELFTTYAEQITRIVSKTDCQEGTLSKHGDVLLPGSTTTTGVDLADASALLLDGVLLGGDINIIRDKGNNFNPIFLAYLLNGVLREDIAKIAKGTTVYHLHGTDLKKLSLKLPSVPEQTAIADILSDMDAEIEALDKKIAKYRAIKDGAMAELLSGRIRLVPPAAPKN